MAAQLGYRGPDGMRFARSRSVVLGHARLAVRDPGPRGAQPMARRDGRWVLVYNGELYGERELRRELRDRGHRFHTSCDTETVLAALEEWGPPGIERLQGMFALAAYDLRERRLVLARDPLGRKPLYWARAGEQWLFASAPPALLAHPHLGAEPDLALVSTYLTTLRTTLCGRTLFQGVRALDPGELLIVDQESLRHESRFPWRSAPVGEPVEPEETARRLHDLVTERTRQHLVSDLPVCGFLSGGLDSTIISSIAVEELGELETWCVGAGSLEEGDPLHAAGVAQHLGTRHHTIGLDREGFEERWREMVSRLGLPLSTPNEVAIFAAAEEMRSHGRVVALSGEGADELFAGYEPLMVALAGHVQSGPEFLSGARFQLEAAAWISPAAKPGLLREDVWRSLEGDAFLIDAYERIFARCQAEAGALAQPLDVHLRFLRRVNLTGLLERLDTSTMLAGIEGRVPLADWPTTRFADSLPIACKFDLEAARRASARGESCGAGKLVLREAFARELPDHVRSRPKASFPLPFQGWMESAMEDVRASALLDELLDPGLRAEVAADPAGNWTYAWPLANLARWGRRWWG